MNNLIELKPRKALNKAFLKVKPNRAEIEGFKTNLITLLDRTNDTESEEFHKNLVSDFLKDTYYKQNHFINTKGRNDLVIHNGQNANSTVGVIIEAKKPTNKTEMITTKKLNAKAFQELVLYYLRERITHKNLEVKHLVATNINEWFIFDATIFDRLFAQNKNLVKQFNDFEGGRLADTKTDFFYKQIAEPFIDELLTPLPLGGAGGGLEFTYFNIQDYQKPLRNVDRADDNSLIALFKLLSPEHLLKLPFTNDSNSLDKSFYSELLYIIGLTETKEGSKKLIERNKAGERHTGAILEDAIIQLDSLDKLNRLEKPNQFGNTQQERLFNVALELSITWVNRILFLKLLEAQLITYHRFDKLTTGRFDKLTTGKGDKSYSFLNLDKIKNYDDLNSLFFQVLARKHDERNEDVKKIFEKVPYLNSSLFEPTDIEQATLFISNLKDDKTIPIFSHTVLKDQQGKKRTGNISTLQYLLEFLDAYDFGAEGGEEIQEDNKTLINASVLGLIFEKINGYKDGSFFTPGFITMYMCRETIRKAVVQKFDQDFPDYKISRIEDIYELIPQKISKKRANEIINSLKICDPAVGSGHFLVSALNEIIAIKNDLKILEDKNGKSLNRYEIEVVNDELIVTDEDGELFEYNPGSTSSPRASESQRVQETLFHEKQTIIENCLFGVDINSNSVKICRLRLWIELLKNAYYIKSASPKSSPPYEGGVAQRAGVVEQLNNLPHLKTFRKELRNNLTPAEAKLWTLLKGKQMEGRKFRRQHSFANYILDFYCTEERLAIELDGQGHFEATQAEYDRERDLFLEHFGIRVLRFENKWVWDNPEGLLETVRSYFGKQPQTSSPDKGRWPETGGVYNLNQPPQSSSPDKGRWSETGGVYNLNQPPRPTDTPPYKGGELNELQTLPNIDINIKCGNSLVSRFAIDADLKQALKKSKWTIDSYRIAVATYRNAESKEQKREMERLIAGIKSDFRSEISLNDPKVKKLRKLSGDLFQMTNQGQLFEMSKKEKADWNKKVQQLTEEIKKLEAEIEEIKANKIFENAFEWRFEFPEVLNDDGDFVGFDVVIGNPPYMRVQEIQASQPTQKLYYESQYQNAKAAYDLANIFFELAVNISSNKSNNAYIFPHKFFNAAASEVFRNYLKQGQYIDEIAHFGANMIFEDADTYTCVAQFSKKPSTGFYFQRFPFKSDFKTLMLDKSKYTFITYDMLEKASKLYGSNQWVLFDDKVGFNVFEKIYNQTARISSKFVRVSQGIATGKDEIYLFEGIQDGEFIQGKFLKDSIERKIEAGVLKRFLKGKDVQRYSNPEKTLFILFPYNVTESGKASIMNEKEIKDKFPNAYQWIKETEEIHRKKDNKSTNDDFWYRYARNQGVDFIELPKLSSMEICAKHPNVIFNTDNFYHPTTVYSWVKREETNESYEYLLAIANSKLLWWFLKSTGDTLQGDARRFKTNYLNPFPLPAFVEQQFENEISDLVKTVMELKKQNEKADTTDLENQIDQLVYQLYDLTAEEIEIIENSVK